MEWLPTTHLPTNPTHLKREKSKARLLRKSSWWRQQLGKGHCYHCGLRFMVEELTMDHLMPIARGGKTNKKNVVVSCKSCNAKKGRRTRAEWLMEDQESSPLA